MLTIVDWQTLSPEEKQQRLSRPEQSSAFTTQVETIISAVKNRGDDALYAFSREFDKVDLRELSVPLAAINAAAVEPVALDALQQALATISTYHQAMRPETKQVTTAKGISIARLYCPIPRVGLYVPGGSNTPLVSSLLMQAIPAKVAGCPVKVLCTPPNNQGKIDPLLLLAARLCDIETIYPIGGAQAIAAMAYGTESITKVDKIFGPGNAYVTEAKTQVASDPQGAAIDLPAGPSEVMILADAKANPDFVAADLLAQAEHGFDSQAFLLCEDLDFAERVNQRLNEQFTKLTRQNIIKKSLQHSSILLCTSRAEQVEIINSYAPEHLIINRKDANNWLPDIISAGTIFLGQWAAETMGDYISGSNHVLPTNGYARNHSGLSTIDFMKSMSVQSISAEGLANLGPAAQTIALLEGLDAHANAIKLRLREC